MSGAGQQYSRDDIYQAIREADKAGDAEAVQRLSQYITTMDEGKPLGQEASQAPQYEGILRKPAMAAQALAQGAAQFAGIPGDVEYLLDSGVNALRGGVSKEEEAAQRKTGLPTGNDLIRGFHLQGEALEPTTPVERYGSAAIKAVPMIGATIASGGAAVPMIAAGEAGALAGEGAHDLLPDSRWAPVVASLLAGLGVGGVTRQVGNTLNARAVNRAVGTAGDNVNTAGNALEEAKEAARLGKFDLATGMKNIREASSKEFAWMRDHIFGARDAIHSKVGEGVEELAKLHGPAASLQEAGHGLQEAARGWLTRTLPKRLEETWTPVNTRIPPDTQLKLDSFTNALDDITTSSGKLEPLTELLKPGLPAKLRERLKSINNLTELADLQPGSFAWKDVQKLRTSLGEAMSNPVVLKDVGQQNLSKLYATLTADMRAAAKAQGDDAVKMFDEANRTSVGLYDTAEGPISRLVAGAKASSSDPLPEKVANALLAGGKLGASDLAVLRREFPEALDNLTAAHMRTNFPGWGKLSPEARASLVPDEARANSIARLVQDREAAAQAAAQGVKMAQTQHQANVAAAREAERTGNFNSAGAVKSSAKALAEAKKAHAAALAAQKALPSNNLLDHSGSTITGILLGEQIGPVVDRLVMHGSGIGPMGGAVIGAVAPKVLRGAVNLLRPTSPEDYVFPALAAGTGSNALRPEKRENERKR